MEVVIGGELGFGNVGVNVQRFAHILDILARLNVLIRPNRVLF